MFPVCLLSVFRELAFDREAQMVAELVMGVKDSVNCSE